MEWWFHAGLIAFGTVWLLLSVAALLGLLLDVERSRESRLTTPLPTDPMTASNASNCGATGASLTDLDPNDVELWPREDGGLIVRKRIKVV